MTFGSNRGLQHRPCFHRTSDPAWSQMSPWPQVAVQAKVRSATSLPYGTRVLRYSHSLWCQTRPQTSVWRLVVTQATDSGTAAAKPGTQAWPLVAAWVRTSPWPPHTCLSLTAVDSPVPLFSTVWRPQICFLFYLSTFLFYLLHLSCLSITCLATTVMLKAAAWASFFWSPWACGDKWTF